MKFGAYLKANMIPEWEKFYVDYDALKKIIKRLQESDVSPEKRAATSLSVPKAPTSYEERDKSFVSQEQFYAALESEMRKIESFTKQQVESVRARLLAIEHSASASSFDVSSPKVVELKTQVEEAGDDFLKLEKFVNMNYTAFHKILKKHDKFLSNPCKPFYSARLLSQSWVRGDYSDILVTMSRVYSLLRGDVEKEATDDAKQNFVRSTRKYWVHTEDISSIKYTVLQHLPVFLQKEMAGETDSQLVNSVYLDNSVMELYRGRLDKTPGAIALRFRWYGSGTPQVVFVERKTHRESWAGEISVKERFIIKESQVLSLLNGTFDLQGEIAKLKAKGKSESDIQEYQNLAEEVIQAINSKQLKPTVRTQYMRVAFQIPFDATVRISLDTNLCMINERTKDTMRGTRWFRDPTVVVPRNEITRFPHGVLEIKLQLQDETKTPKWVQELLISGKLLEVHKFSKFIHGCAVLMTDDVPSVPYWVDDVTLAQSITLSGAEKLLQVSEGANRYYSQLLPHDEYGNVKAIVNTAFKEDDEYADNPLDDEEGEDILTPDPRTDRLPDVEGGASSLFMSCIRCDICCSEQCQCFDEFSEWAGCAVPSDALREKVAEVDLVCAHDSQIEPKLFFANERTYLSWLHMSIMLTSLSIAVVALTPDHSLSQFYGFMMMPIALMFVMYGVWTYLWRIAKIQTRDTDRWDEPYGPIILTASLIAGLFIQFFLTLNDTLNSRASNY